MQNIEYVKNYKEKELRQYVTAFLLVAVASVGFQTQLAGDDVASLLSLVQMVIIDILIGAICVLVFVLNELWSDKAKTRIAYRELPSDTVFADIAGNKLDATGFDLDKAKVMFAELSAAPPAKQTAEWNVLLRKSRDDEGGNVVEAERLQLMTRDICMSTFSLLIMTVIAVIVLAVWRNNMYEAINTLWLPIVYLLVMMVITRKAAQNRARRFVALVIKNAVQDCKGGVIQNKSAVN